MPEWILPFAAGLVIGGLATAVGLFIYAYKVIGEL